MVPKTKTRRETKLRPENKLGPISSTERVDTC